MKIEYMSIDIESFSSVDLKTSGVYRYSESPDFEILLLGYSVNGGPVKTVDIISGEEVPMEIIKAIARDDVIKWAFNASFERICLSSWLKKHFPSLFHGYGTGDDYIDYLSPTSWRCSMVWSAYLGLPLSLAGVGKILKLDEQKMTEGKSLITYFCCPCAPTKSNGGRTRNLPHHDTEKWSTFKSYNIRDVEVEMAIQKKLSNHPVPDMVWDEYHIDQTINDRGILVDMTLVENAIKFDEISRSSIIERLQHITGVENPNSVAQMKTWLSDQGVETETLGKKTVQSLISETEGEIRDALILRLQCAKSSIKKYQAMKNTVCKDNRARGMFQFYGANRTGRWSGRNVQLQNLRANHLDDINGARSLVISGDYEMMGMLYDDIPDALSQLVRTAFVPRRGYKFIVSDFSAIEARVLAWLAGEQWVLDVFASGGDIYCETASRMFGVPVVKHGINGDLRQKGKQATLSCIAEGQLVLTDRGLVPIEEVTLDDKVWDGEEWVEHEGVVYKEEREVVTYEGLTATPDHLVYVEGKNAPLPFSDAIMVGAHLVKTGETRKDSRPVIKAKVYDILNAGPRHRFTVSGHLVHNCGYGGGPGALKAMGAIEAGMKEEELKPLVDAWRSANPNIVKFWWEMDAAVRRVIRERTSVKVRCITLEYRGGMMFMRLPSGRMLSYVKPKLGKNAEGTEVITYEGIGNTKKWERVESYGPKFVENATQAISRDILAYAMKTLQDMKVVAHVHDELIIECPMGTKVDDVSAAMAILPPWVPGLCLRADGDEMEFYQKA